MKIADLDYYAIFGNTFLHKIKTKYKLASLLFLLLGVLIFKNIIFYILIYSILILLISFSGIPKRKAFAASLYPLIFTVIFLISCENMSLLNILTLVLRVLCISTSLIILIFTTSYTEIFRTLSMFLPEIIVNILFNTYRALFIIGNILENLLVTIKLRGKIDFLKPLQTLEIFGNLIGFFIIKSIETGEKMHDGIKLRGYSDKFFYQRD